MAYASVNDVRLLTGLSTNDINDADLTSIIAFATYQVNSDIQVTVVREKVEYIDNTRQNDINSSNTTFYVKTWKDYYIGDANNDGAVTVSDLTVYLVSSDGTETTTTVSTITANSGKFVLSAAPAGGKDMYVSYSYSPVSMSDPNALVKTATAYISGAISYLKINPRKLQSYSIGKLRVSKQAKAYDEYYDKYKQIIHQIKNRPLKKITGSEIREIVRPGLGLGTVG